MPIGGVSSGRVFAQPAKQARLLADTFLQETAQFHPGLVGHPSVWGQSQSAGWGYQSQSAGWGSGGSNTDTSTSHKASNTELVTVIIKGLATRLVIHRVPDF